MTALAWAAVIVGAVAAVCLASAGVAVLICRSIRHADQQAGITQAQQDADQARWLDERRKPR